LVCSVCAEGEDPTTFFNHVCAEGEDPTTFFNHVCAEGEDPTTFFNHDHDSDEDAPPDVPPSQPMSPLRWPSVFASPEDQQPSSSGRTAAAAELTSPRASGTSSAFTLSRKSGFMDIYSMSMMLLICRNRRTIDVRHPYQGF
jgi:hypothetical protein